MSPWKLSRGQNVPLPAKTNRIGAVIGWADPEVEVDASALLLGSNGKVGSDADFVFYNQSRSADGSVRFEGIERTPMGARARLAIDLSAVPHRIRTVVLAGSVTARNFGALGDLSFEILDEAGQALAEYVASEADTETAFVFGEIYRWHGAWKVRAVGQGWDSGLAGLATDFGVAVDNADEPAPVDQQIARHLEAVARTSDHPIGSAYRLWSQPRSCGDHELTVTHEYFPAIQSLLPQDVSEDRVELTPELQLVPEPHGPRGPFAISVRTAGRTIGYLDAETAWKWAGPVRRIVTSGFIATTSGHISYSEYDSWDGTGASAWIRLGLGEAFDAIPLSQPPAGRTRSFPGQGLRRYPRRTNTSTFSASSCRRTVTAL